jgi:hypothetical protein
VLPPGFANRVSLSHEDRKERVYKVMQHATSDDQRLKNDERLLARLSFIWWQSRAGSPGFHWANAREVLTYDKVRAALAARNWNPEASDKDLYAIFISAVAKEFYKERDFDSWESGPPIVGKWSHLKEVESRKREASRMCSLQRATRRRPRPGLTRQAGRQEAGLSWYLHSRHHHQPQQLPQAPPRQLPQAPRRVHKSRKKPVRKA